MRPAPGVEPLALEILQPRNVGHIGVRKTADGGDQPCRLIDRAVFAADAPEPRRPVPARRRHPPPKVDVRVKVQPRRHMVEIGADFGVSGISLRPVPTFVDLAGKEVLIGMALAVAARARIAVPPPRPANSLRRLDDAGVQPQPVPQQMKLIKSAKAGADDQHVQPPHACPVRSVSHLRLPCHLSGTVERTMRLSQRPSSLSGNTPAGGNRRATRGPAASWRRSRRTRSAGPNRRRRRRQRAGALGPTPPRGPPARRRNGTRPAVPPAASPPPLRWRP